MAENDYPLIRNRVFKILNFGLGVSLGSGTCLNKGFLYWYFDGYPI